MAPYTAWTLHRGAMHTDSVDPVEIDEARGLLCFPANASRAGSVPLYCTIRSLVGFKENGLAPTRQVVFFDGMHDRGQTEEIAVGPDVTVVTVCGRRFYRFQRPPGNGDHRIAAMFAEELLETFGEIASPMLRGSFGVAPIPPK